MNTKKPPRELVFDVLERSPCNMVQVGAVISDRWGNFSWGRNHPVVMSNGPGGCGMCAERDAIKRANRNRLPGSTLTVAAKWRRSGNLVSRAEPCKKCMAVILSNGIATVEFITKSGVWEVMYL